MSTDKHAEFWRIIKESKYLTSAEDLSNAQSRLPMGLEYDPEDVGFRDQWEEQRARQALFNRWLEATGRDIRKNRPKIGGFVPNARPDKNTTKGEEK